MRHDLRHDLRTPYLALAFFFYLSTVLLQAAPGAGGGGEFFEAEEMGVESGGNEY